MTNFIYLLMQFPRWISSSITCSYLWKSCTSWFEWWREKLHSDLLKVS